MTITFLKVGCNVIVKIVERLFFFFYIGFQMEKQSVDR